MPSTRYGRPDPPEYTDPRGRRRRSARRGSSTSSTRPTPVIVPPVPTPATKWVMRPPVWRQISGPVECSCAQGFQRFAYWFGRNAPGVSLHQPFGHRVVRLRIVGLDRNRAHDDFRAVRRAATRSSRARPCRSSRRCIGSRAARRRWRARPRCCPRWARRSSPGSQQALAFGRVDHRYRGTVLDAAPGFVSLELGHDLAPQLFGRRGEVARAACCRPGREASRRSRVRRAAHPWTTQPLHALEVTVAGNHRIALLPVMGRRQAASPRAGLRPDDLRRDVGARCGNGAVNLGQGFPDTDGPAVIARGRDRRHPRRPQPVPARHRHRRAAPRHRGPPTALLRHRARSRRRGARHRGRDRSARRDVPRAVRPGRRSDHLRAVVRRVRRRAALAGAVRRIRDPAAAGLRIRRRRRCGAAVTPRTRFVLLNSPHNPTGKVFTAHELDADRCHVRRPRSSRGHRRGVRASRVRRPSTFPWTLPGMANGRSRSPRRARRSRSPAGRSAGSRVRPTSSPPSAREAVADLRQRRAPSSMRWRSDSASATTCTAGAGRRPARQARPLCARASSTPASRSSFPPGRTSSTADVRSLGEDDGLAFCRALPGAAVWSRCRTSCSTTTSKQASRLCASRSASVTSARRSAHPVEEPDWPEALGRDLRGAPLGALPDTEPGSVWSRGEQSRRARLRGRRVRAARLGLLAQLVSSSGSVSRSYASYRSGESRGRPG